MARALPARSSSARSTRTRRCRAARTTCAAPRRRPAAARSPRAQIVAPFVVVGDGSAAALERDASTVRWAVEHLEADFFAHRPARIIDIYLFHDADSYEHGVKLLTGEAPTTPYGFYSKQYD